MHTSDTLTRAYRIAEQAGQPLTPESAAIQYYFITEQNIQEFGDDELYLNLLSHLFANRYNVSYPEDSASYRHFFEDCIQLKQLMNHTGTFSPDHYLNYALLLLENLKTPYYTTYSRVLYALRSCFKQTDLFDNVLKDFYALIIKSDTEALSCICRIAEQADFYQQYFSESLITQILLEHLSLFAQKKGTWITVLFEQMYGVPVNFEKIDTYGLLCEFLIIEKQHIENIVFEKDSAATHHTSAEEKKSSSFDLSCFLADRMHFLGERMGNLSEEEQQPPGRVFRGNLTSYKRYHPTVDSDFLNTYAYDMTGQHFTCDPAIDRDEELRDLELILISPKKSPILIGEAGVGKTSVAEGLAYRLQKGDVPKLLKDRKLYKLTTTSLLSGTKYVGEMEERMKSLTAELEKHPEVILFIDEIHTIVGAGSTVSSNNDISNMLKPYIDRGDIKIIGATTQEEYSHFLLPDRALARRFYPIVVEEPNQAMVYDILAGTIPKISQETNVRCTCDTEELHHILETLIHVSAPDNQLEGHLTKMPELPLTLLEMAFSYAALDSRDVLERKDCIRAVRHSSQLKKEIRRQAESLF